MGSELQAQHDAACAEVDACHKAIDNCTCHGKAPLKWWPGDRLCDACRKHYANGEAADELATELEARMKDHVQVKHG